MIIVVYNTCGIGGVDHSGDYIPRIESCLAQVSFDGLALSHRVVVSGCRIPPAQKDRLMKHFGGRVSYWWTEETLPVNITFNRAAEMACRQFGEPEGFVYVDSGCHLEPDVLSKLRHSPLSEPRFVMRSALANTDMGFALWFPGVRVDDILKDPVFTVPVGRTVNLHVMWFHPVIARRFGHLIPDVFARFCTESTFTFVCAAVGGRMGLWRDARVSHWHGMDGGSSGFPPGPCDWDHLMPQAVSSMKEVIESPMARECGFGYEECQNIFLHDPTAYNEDGTAKDPGLLGSFVDAAIYLPKHKFHYDNIEEVWVP